MVTGQKCTSYLGLRCNSAPFYVDIICERSRRRIDRAERFVRLSDPSEKNGLVRCAWCDYEGRQSTVGYHQMKEHKWGNFFCTGNDGIQ